jgi:serine/threonine protein kinase
MSPEQWQKVKEIFNAAIESPVIEREALLDNESDAEVLREVEKLLLADADDSFSEMPVVNLSELWRDDAAENFEGKQIGNYKIVREIGRGGMGTVFEAVRETDGFVQRVAVKLIKRGMDTDEILRRFRNERKILAELNHPNIARLVDGGTSADGLPFLAMEYVEGANVLDFADEKKLTVSERLALFREICAAISYAHQNLVIHRDIKPSNILVTEDGTPKLLDFGISKLLSASGEHETATALQFQMMTPAYASPEQLRGENITTTSDVYSLGVVLYELLTGKRPFDLASQRREDYIRAVSDTEPKPPSSVVQISDSKFQIPNLSTNDGRQTTNANGQSVNPKSKIQNSKSLKGDLDNIILKALRKESERRYSSVEQFSEDIRRHLEGLPVKARAATVSYRAEKFVKRNRAAVAGAALVFLTLIGGIVGVTSQYVRAERQRVLAERRFADVREIANNVVFKYHDEIKNLPGSTKAREMLIKDALIYLNRLSEDEAGDVSLKIELAQAFMKIGDVQGQAYDANLGDTAGAIESYRKAIMLLEESAQNSADLKTQNELATAYQKIAALIGDGGSQKEGYEFAQKAVALGERLAAANPASSEQQLKLAGFYLYLGDNLPDQTAHETNIEIYQKALEISEAVYDAEPQNPLAVRRITGLTQRLGFQNFLLAENAAESGSRERAFEFFTASLTLYQRSFEMAKRLFAFDPQNAVYRRTLSSTKLNLSQAQRELGETGAALAAQREVLQEVSSIAESDVANVEAQYDLANIHDDVARTFVKRKEFAEAFNHFRQAQKLFDAAIEKNPNSREFFISRFNSINRLGNALTADGDFEEAIKTHRSAFEKIKNAPVLQDAASKAFFEGEIEEKLGDTFAALAAKETDSATRQKHLEAARAAYQKAVKLWRQPECWQVNFAKNAGRFDFVARKLANMESEKAKT